MSYTRSAPARTTRTTTTASTDKDDEDGVRCSGHNRKAAKRQAGPATKNAGRWFYVCPLGRDDPKKCKFFKWADEVDVAGAGGGPSERPSGGRTLGGGQTLGQSPARLGGVSSLLTTGNSTNSSTRPAAAGTQSPATPKKAASPAKSSPVQPSITAWLSPTRQPAPESDSGEFSDDELDWSAIDTDAIELAARTATPHTSQVAPSPASTTGPRTPTSAGARLRAAAIREAVGGGGGERPTTAHGSPTAFGARLRAVAIAEAKAEDTQAHDASHAGEKRRGEDVKDTRVPKRGGGANPFRDTTR